MVAAFLTISGYLLSIGIVLYGVFFFWIAQPQLYFEIFGERTGEPIRIPPGELMLSFAIGTTGKKPVEIKTVEVKYDPFQGVKLKADSEIGQGPDPTPGKQFPLKITFRGPFHIDQDTLLSLGIKSNCNETTPAFSLKLDAVAKVPAWAIHFPFTMFSPLERKFERVVSFVCSGYPPMSEVELIAQYGLTIGPLKRMSTQGDAAKEGTKAVAPHGPVRLKVFEILRDEHKK